MMMRWRWGGRREKGEEGQRQEEDRSGRDGGSKSGGSGRVYLG